jgi:hypothetical protein
VGSTLGETPGRADLTGMGKARLSMAFQDLRGGVGGVVCSKTRGGNVVKRKPRYRYPVQPSLREVQARMKEAMAVWSTLTWEQVEEWNAYARGLERVDSITGAEYSPSGINAFMGLSTKFLQVNPEEPIPLAPPTWEMQWDHPMVSATGGTGVVQYTASGPTPEGIVAELLAQPLLNQRRSPTKFYKSQAFVSFTDEHPSAQVTLAPGWYALAVRFVEVSTGRATLLTPMGRVEVI